MQDIQIKIRESVREAAKKVPPLMVRPLRGGGVKAGPLKKNFFEALKPPSPPSYK